MGRAEVVGRAGVGSAHTCVPHAASIARSQRPGPAVDSLLHQAWCWLTRARPRPLSTARGPLICKPFSYQRHLKRQMRRPPCALLLGAWRAASAEAVTASSSRFVCSGDARTWTHVLYPAQGGSRPPHATLVETDTYAHTLDRRPMEKKPTRHFFSKYLSRALQRHHHPPDPSSPRPRAGRPGLPGSAAAVSWRPRPRRARGRRPHPLTPRRAQPRARPPAPLRPRRCRPTPS